VITGLVMVAGGIAAGAFGSLLGLGGGVLIVPLLTLGVLGFSLPLREAVGVSLVCVIVTSGAAASVYLARHAANLRLGMVLELFTALGAVAGGLIAFAINEQTLAILFALLLVYVAFSMARGARATPAPVAPAAPPDPPSAEDLPVAAETHEHRPPADEHGGFVASLSGPDYHVHRLAPGSIGSVGAGVVSALLGIGGGLIKVPVMHLVMGVPLRVATATSNLMIGITASASAVIYLLRGEIDPYIAGPTAIGVFIGATVGSRLAPRIDVRWLRILFVVVLLYTAFQMLQRALP
jgi:uncharacterized membrane protein YfcA